MIGIIIITGLILSLYGLAYLICHVDDRYYRSSGVATYYKNFRNYYEQAIIIPEKKKEQHSNIADEAYILDIPEWKIKMIEEINVIH